MFGSNKKMTCILSCVIHMTDLIGWVKRVMCITHDKKTNDIFLLVIGVQNFKHFFKT